MEPNAQHTDTSVLNTGPQRTGSSCRFCNTPLRHTFVDLGMSPLCQNRIKPEQLQEMEPFYPLHVYVCHSCFLVQLNEIVSPMEIYKDYAYFSSYSDSWLEHCKAYVEMMVEKFTFNKDHFVVELASNDGYLLQYFKQKGIPLLGIEPAANAAKLAEEKGIESWVKFFGRDTAREIVQRKGKADLILGNNVLAHVPDINDFVGGMKVLLAPSGLITMEFPHLLNLVQYNQFDTIYHEHYSYLSLYTVEKIFSEHGLHLFDVEELPTHGGSIRIYAQHQESGVHTQTTRYQAILKRELDAGIDQLTYYSAFTEQVKATKRRILSFLISAKESGKTVVGYGAPGKGNTLLNYCGIGTDFLDFTVDRNPYKQGHFLPGSHIPILHPDAIRQARPDYVLILPWNLKDEIMQQLSYIQDWGGRFVLPIPELSIA